MNLIVWHQLVRGICKRQAEYGVDCNEEDEKMGKTEMDCFHGRPAINISIRRGDHLAYI